MNISMSDRDSAIILPPINFDSFNIVLSAREPRSRQSLSLQRSEHIEENKHAFNRVI